MLVSSICYSYPDINESQIVFKSVSTNLRLSLVLLYRKVNKLVRRYMYFSPDGGGGGGGGGRRR